jgi:DNA-directed RNA polymerase specialized sigma24 family protein
LAGCRRLREQDFDASRRAPVVSEQKSRGARKVIESCQSTTTRGIVLREGRLHVITDVLEQRCQLPPTGGQSPVLRSLVRGRRSLVPTAGMSRPVPGGVAAAGVGPSSTSLTKATVDAALAGDRRVLRELVTTLTPLVQTRVTRTVLRRRGTSAGDVRAFVEDLVQDTFVALLHDRGKLLRTWNPERGLSLESFVGLVAEQRVLATLRSRRKNPWTEELAVDDADLDVADPHQAGPEALVSSRAALQSLFDEVRARLSPLGFELFMALVVREESAASVSERTKLSISAVHAWSSRLKRLVHALAASEVGEHAAGGSPGKVPR